MLNKLLQAFDNDMLTQINIRAWNLRHETSVRRNVSMSHRVPEVKMSRHDWQCRPVLAAIVRRPPALMKSRVGPSLTRRNARVLGRLSSLRGIIPGLGQCSRLQKSTRNDRVRRSHPDRKKLAVEGDVPTIALDARHLADGLRGGARASASPA